MRRIDVIGIGVGVFTAGGLLYVAFSWAGFDGQSAGIWSQVVFVTLLLGWTASYLTRVVGKNMTYDQQLKEYEDAVLQKRLAEMSPQEIAQLQAEVEQERLAQQTQQAPASESMAESVSEDSFLA